jgi:transposase
MDNRKYVGMDVHQASISVAVRDSAGKLVMECIIETKAATVLEFIRGLRGNLWVAFEEGTSAAWLYDLLKPHVARVVVCDPRKNALLKAGNKNDWVDARKLSELLRAELLTPVYHGECGVRTLRELSRSYLTVTKDLNAGHESAQSPLSKLGDTLRWSKSIFTAPPQQLAGTTVGSGRASSR